MKIRTPLVAGALTLQCVFGAMHANAQTVTQDTILPAIVAAVATSIAPVQLGTAPDDGARMDAFAGSLVMAARPAGVTRSASPMRALDDTFSSQDTIPRRKAVSYSEWYSRRLKIHRYGSYAMIPLFVTQYVLGAKLLKQKEALYAGSRTESQDGNLKSAHGLVAGGVGVLFGVNTITGLWNLYDSRHAEEGRKLRTVHAITMLAADAGFAYTGLLGSSSEENGSLSDARKHRNAGVASFGIATVGSALMWFGR